MFECMRENENYWLGGDMVERLLFVTTVGEHSSCQHSSGPELLPPPPVAAEEQFWSVSFFWNDVFCVCVLTYSQSLVCVARFSFFFFPVCFMYKYFNSLKDIYKDECNVHAAIPSQERFSIVPRKRGGGGCIMFSKCATAGLKPGCKIQEWCRYRNAKKSKTDMSWSPNENPSKQIYQWGSLKQEWNA